MLNRWQGETVCIIAPGPSLTHEDAVHAGARARTIAVNEAWRWLPSADALYGADANWWRLSAPPANAFRGERWAADKHWRKGEAERLGITTVPVVGGAGIVDAPPIRTGSNSGFQALGLAVVWGARRIVLLGLDLQYGPKGEKHCHGDHKEGLRAGPGLAALALFLDAFEKSAPALASRGISVINASRQTALKAYPRMMVQDALP